MKEEIEKIRAALLIKSPFFAFLLIKCRIEIDDRLIYPAANDGKRTIYVNPLFFEKLTTEDKLFILSHEVGHLALLTAKRRKGRDPLLWNVATDCVINYLLSKDVQPSPMLYNSIVTPNKISEMTGIEKSKIEKMTADQIYNLLLRVQQKNIPRPGGCSHDEHASPDVGGGGEEDEEDPKEKEFESSGGGEDEREIEEFWKRAIAEAYSFAATAGKFPAGAEILLEQLKPKVNWRTILRQAVVNGPGMRVLTTYTRPNRRIPNDVPGYRRQTVPAVWLLIDTSGSVVGRHLNQMVSEVLSIAKMVNSKVKVIAWDTEPYEMSIEDIKSRMRIHGGGGTEIRKALMMLLRRMTTNDVVIVMSDGVIGDINEADVQRMLDKVVKKASAAIFLTTVEKPALPPGWKIIFLSL